MRISGIASGFDTEEMVRQLMQVERMKVDRFEQNRQTILWRQEAYNNINKSFANFILNTQKDMGLKKASSTGSLFDSSYKNLDYVRKATSSNEATATVTSTGKTTNGNYTFTVDNLAETASFSSGDNVVPKDLSGYAKEIQGEDGKSYLELEFKINDQSIKISKEIKDEDNKPTISIDDVAKVINSTKTKTAEGKEVSLGVTAFSANGKLFIQTEKTGTSAKIEIDDESGLFKDLGYTDSISGKDAQITLNNTKLTYESNKINLNGLDIELKSVSEVPVNISVSTNTEGIMEKIEKLIEDYNNLVDLASGLVNEKVYSSYKPLSQEERKALSESDVKLWDEKAKSGLLNRDETLQRTLQNIRTDLYRQVEGVNGSFNHITQIGITTEKYARGSAGGKLQIDTDKLRKAIEEDPEGVMELLFKEPEAKRFTATKPKKEDYENGPIDGQTYEDAVKNYEELKRVHDREERSNRRDSGGIFTRVYDNLIDGMKNIIEKSGPGEDADLYRGVRSNMLIDFVTKKSSISDLDKSISEMDRQIDNLNILLAKREEMHYAKFTAMEKAMYQMNNQSGWLAQQFG